MTAYRPRLMIGFAAAALMLAACQPREETAPAVEATPADASADLVAEAAAADISVDAADAATYTADDGAAVVAAATADEGYRIVESDRTYYYRRGERAPYLVRRGDDFIAYRDGRPERMFDAQGRDLPADRRENLAGDAERWADRGRDLHDDATPRVRDGTPTQTRPTPPASTPGGPTTGDRDEPQTSGRRDARDPGSTDGRDRAATDGRGETRSGREAGATQDRPMPEPGSGRTSQRPALTPGEQPSRPATR